MTSRETPSAPGPSSGAQTLETELERLRARQDAVLEELEQLQRRSAELVAEAGVLQAKERTLQALRQVERGRFGAFDAAGKLGLKWVQLNSAEHGSLFEDPTADDLVLIHVGALPDKAWQATEIEAAIEAGGWGLSRSGIRTGIDRAYRSGHLERVARGQYRISKEGERRLSSGEEQVTRLTPNKEVEPM